jgi:hypothetical protein
MKNFLPLAETPEFKILRRVTPFEFSGMTSADIPPFSGPPVRTAAVQ